MTSMTQHPIALSRLPVGQCGVVLALLTEGSMRRRLLDLGITKGSGIECIGESPAKDPRAYLVRGTVIAIRSKDSHKILILPKEKE